MAAELFLTFAIQQTLKRVSSIAAEEIRLAWGLKGQLRKLDVSLAMIQDVLQEAARRPVTDNSVKLLLEKLQDVAYKAEDVLDDFAYEILRKDQMKGRIQVVVRRDGDVFKIMNLLTGSIDQQVLPVIPIVGMAGLGKTTIAKKICELAMEKKHFDVTLWVCASNDFNKRRILGEMLQKIDEHTGGLSNLDAILQKLQQKLEDKTFLLVLDDVWNEDHALEDSDSFISSNNPLFPNS
ncbi:hypothetical protein OIU85_004044 [Salix viminalis]|uniref:NB-ARC domain-containing protein n=1 Tax=Salix viminalis TaxID=40686 RepID=A0A9Q0SXT1_SALVM|nr:hypothetical protein OIU85_004044 [Salix viminalis]